MRPVMPLAALRSSLRTSTTPSLIAIVIASTSLGCIAADPDEGAVNPEIGVPFIEHECDPGVRSLPDQGGGDPAADDESCLVGAWISPESDCDCPSSSADGATAECFALDCREAEMLMMLACGDAIGARIRWSATARRMSAAAGPHFGTWQYLDDGELRLELAGNATYVPTECGGSSGGELQMKGRPLMKHPPAALAAAITLAWSEGDWQAMPYFP